MKSTSALLICALFIALSAGVKVKFTEEIDDSLPVGALGFQRIFFMIFENQPYTKVYNNKDFHNFAKEGMILTDYYTSWHPSQPNYIDSICGSNMGCTSDSNIDIAGTSIVDRMEAAGISWKAYAEDFPGDCYTGSHSGKYYRKHVPMMSMNNVRHNWCKKIVNAYANKEGLDFDLKNGSLPQYSYFTPNIDNDGHNTDLTFAGEYLTTFFSNRTFPKGTLVYISWDEDDHSENNHLYTAFQGSMVAPCSSDGTHYTHDSFPKSVEKNWNLKDLGRRDVHANAFTLKSQGGQKGC